MKLRSKSLKTALACSLLLVPALTGCSSSDEKEKNVKVTEKSVSSQGTNAVTDIANSLKKSLKSVTNAIESGDKGEAKKKAEALNSEWLKKENTIRESFPLIYTDIEKYMQPLYIEATSDDEDLDKMKNLAADLDKALEKLANAKETEEKTSEILNQAVIQYEQYVRDEITELVSSTKLFTDAVREGDIETAKKQYAISRTHYERVEPVAESFGELDPKIDAREGDVDDSEWGGFHRIEKALWVDGTTEGMAQYADQLDADIAALQEEVENLKLKPTQVVAGAMELINEAAITKVTGEEERYSRIDLMDLAANVEGSQAVYFAILPALTENDAQLADKLDGQFTSLLKTLQSYKKNGQYILYTDLKEEQIREMSQQLGVLAGLMGETAKILQ